MRIDIPRTACFLLCVISLSWFIPHFYDKATRLDRFYTNGFFSPVTKEFVISQINLDNFTYYDEKGNVLNKFEAQKLLPFVYAGNINKWGGFPIETDDGIITYEFAANSLMAARVLPSSVLAENLPLYLLYESAPFGTTLEIPSDILSIKSDRLIFINCADGTINQEKSELFTEALKNAGVVFPIAAAAVNPYNLKPFDEGMFFADNANRVFQLKIIEGAPFIRSVNITTDEKILYMNVDEDYKKIFYGIIVTEKSIYLNMYEGGAQKLPIEGYNPRTDAAGIIFTPFYKIITKRDLSAANPHSHFIAADKNFDIFREYEEKIPNNVMQKREYVSYGLSFLAPFSLSQFSHFSHEVLFEIAPAPHFIFALLGIVFALILYFCINLTLKRRLDILTIFAICFTGILGLIASAAFSPLSKKSKGQ
ncbi:MAG: DUF4857 domain-containing protein [Campylobacteraceae bacterium]|jgi:hypothetical protein|nr:DUF4857 domain-containing protein [Campylobacteraceae bacterium]